MDDLSRNTPVTFPVEPMQPYQFRLQVLNSTYVVPMVFTRFGEHPSSDVCH